MSSIQLVTGGAGYFGGALVRSLAEAGATVRVFDLNDADDLPEGVELVRGDIRDRDAVERACRGVETIYHNVALVPLANDKKGFHSVIEGGTRNLLEASVEQGVRKVVHTSSSAIFGIPDRNPVDEAAEPKPLEAYGRAKLEAEHICREYVERGLDVTIVRPRTIMGHGRLGIMQVIFEWVRQGRNVPVLGRGENIYQFVHADDLAAACLAAAARTGPEIYHIGAGEFGTMRETLEALTAHAGTGSRVVSLPMGPAVAMMKLTSALRLSPLVAYHWLLYGRSMYFDIGKARRELEWEPRYSNAEMFKQSYDGYLENREEVLAASGRSHHLSGVKQGVLGLVGRVLSIL